MVTAQEMGKKGGSATSQAKTAAARKNARKPRGKWVTAIAYELAGVKECIAFGSVITTGRAPTEALVNHEWVCKKLREEGVGLRNETVFEFKQLATTGMLI